MPKHVGSKLNFLIFLGISLPLLIGVPSLNCKLEPIRQVESDFSDFDNDGILDQVDLDDDNDGISDEIETSADIDGDGIANSKDRDSDGDGIPDLIEATGVDKDGDGMLDLWDEWEDGNYNGFHDEYEFEPLAMVTTHLGRKVWQGHHQFGDINLDQDNDGIPNFWDEDSDGDGISDKQESGNQFNSSKMVDTNADGFDDRLVGHVFTQGDKYHRNGHPEFTSFHPNPYDTNAPDGSFGELNGLPDIDDNGNGIPDFLESNLKSIKH